MLESKKQMEVSSPSPRAKEESATSSPVLLAEDSGLLKSKDQAAKQPQTKLNLSPESMPRAALPLSPTRWMKLSRLLKTLPKALFLWGAFKFAKLILKWRNRSPKILIHPDPRLKRIAEPVDFEKTKLAQRTTIVRKMGAALAKTTWGMRLGIAAPQIGINLRIMIVRGNVMFNPNWQPTKAPPETIEEGCYSAPYKTFKVSRALYVWAKWMDITGHLITHKLKGLPAIVFQHELNHLDGVCIADIGEEVKNDAIKSL